MRNMKLLHKNVLNALLLASATNVSDRVARTQVESVRWKLKAVLHSVNFVGCYPCMCNGNNATTISHWQLQKHRATHQNFGTKAWKAAGYMHHSWVAWFSLLLYADTVIRAEAGTRTATLGGFHISTTWQVCVCVCVKYKVVLFAIFCFVLFFRYTYAWSVIIIYILFPA